MAPVVAVVGAILKYDWIRVAGVIFAAAGDVVSDLQEAASFDDPEDFGVAVGLVAVEVEEDAAGALVAVAAVLVSIVAVAGAAVAAVIAIAVDVSWVAGYC
ncbi:hypothetical protein FBU30_005191 [Linnemannia zychae]|nr:hypothetical protein FBU30_005191 [Linnemannia zychae]